MFRLKANCCDGVYDSFDVHFTSACDNKCAHCIDMQFNGMGVTKPDIGAIVTRIVENKEGLKDVLFLGGEPCLYLEELLECVQLLRQRTNLKLYVTTSVPKTCFDNQGLFFELIDALDGINLSVQHYDESVADRIRNVPGKYDRQAFYNSLPHKEKIRINLNVVKPFLYTKDDLMTCLAHYDKMGFSSIKLSEIQHGTDVYVSFAEVFGMKLPSPFSHGCQTYIDMAKIIPNFKTPMLLKRSCFLCESSLKATAGDGLKVITKAFVRPTNVYGVVYGDGTLTKGWV